MDRFNELNIEFPDIDADTLDYLEHEVPPHKLVDEDWETGNSKRDDALLAIAVLNNKDFQPACEAGDLAAIFAIIDAEMDAHNLHTYGARKLRLRAWHDCAGLPGNGMDSSILQRVNRINPVAGLRILKLFTDVYFVLTGSRVGDKQDD